MEKILVKTPLELHRALQNHSITEIEVSSPQNHGEFLEEFVSTLRHVFSFNRRPVHPIDLRLFFEARNSALERAHHLSNAHPESQTPEHAELLEGWMLLANNYHDLIKRVSPEPKATDWLEDSISYANSLIAEPPGKSEPAMGESIRAVLTRIHELGNSRPNIERVTSPETTNPIIEIINVYGEGESQTKCKVYFYGGFSVCRRDGAAGSSNFSVEDVFFNSPNEEYFKGFTERLMAPR